MNSVIDLTEENVFFYEDYIGADMAENIGRSNFRGMVVTQPGNDPVAGMIWELRDSEAGSEKESVIEWIHADNELAFREMMDSYKEWVEEDEAVRSVVAISAKNGKGMRQLLKGVGFDMKLTESDTIIARLSELENIELMKKMQAMEVPDSIGPLKSFSVRSYRDAVVKCVQMGRTGICPDLDSLSVAWFEEDVSCMSEADGAANGMFLFHAAPSGLIVAQLLICLDKTTATTVPLMMLQFIKAMKKKYDPDTKVALNRHNMQTLLLTEKLLPRGFGIPVYSGSREEQ